MNDLNDGADHSRVNESTNGNVLMNRNQGKIVEKPPSSWRISPRVRRFCSTPSLDKVHKMCDDTVNLLCT